MPTIFEILHPANVDKATKGYIEQIEKLYEMFKGSSLIDFFDKGEEGSINPILNQLKTLELNAITTQNPSKEEFGTLQQKKKKDIGTLASKVTKNVLKTSKEILVKKSGSTAQDKIVKDDQERNKIYLGLARACYLKDEIVNNGVNGKKALEAYSNLIVSKLGAIEDIKLSDLGKMIEWASFKIALKREKHRRDGNRKTTQEPITASASDAVNLDITDSSEAFAISSEENTKLSKEGLGARAKTSSLPNNNLDNTVNDSVLNSDTEASGLSQRIKTPLAARQAKIDNLEEQLKEKINHVTHLNEKVKNLQEHLTVKEKNLKTDQENAEKRSSIVELLEKIEKSTDKEKSQQDKISKLEASEKDLKSKLIKLEQEIVSLKNLVSEKQYKISKLESSKAYLKSEIDRFDQENTSLQDLVLIEKNKLTEQLAKKNTEIEEWKAKSVFLSEELASTKQRLSNSQEEERRFQESLKQSKVTIIDLNTKVDLSENELTKVNKEIKDLSQKFKSAQEDKNNSQQALKKAKETLKASNEKIVTLEAKLQDIQLSDSNNKGLIDQLQSKLVELQSVNSIQESSVQRFKEEIAEKETIISEVKNERNKFQLQIKKQCDELDAHKLQQLRHKEINSELNEKLKEKNSEIVSLQVALKQAQKEVDDGKITLQTLQAEKIRADSNAEEFNTQLETINEALQGSKDLAEKTQSELSQLKLQAEQAKEKAASLQKQKQAADHQVREAKVDIGNLKAQLAQYTTVAEEFSQNLDSIDEQEDYLARLNALRAVDDESLSLLPNLFHDNSHSALENADSGIEHDDGLIAIDNTLVKQINSGEMLSEEQLQSLSPTLQYTNNPEDFSLALQRIYPKDFTSPFQVSDEVFEQARFVLRKQALETIKKQCSDPAIDKIDDSTIRSLEAKAWLEKKHQLITGTVIDVKLTKPEQLEINHAFAKLFPLSTLEHAAVTAKSSAELEKELKNLNNIQLELSAQTYDKQFQEIENTLLTYSTSVLINPGSEAFSNFIQEVSNVSVYGEHSFHLNNESAKALLNSITQHIENGVNKWYPLSDSANAELRNKVTKDTEQVLASVNPRLTSEDIKLLIATAINAFKRCRLADKKKFWQESINLHYAMTEKIANLRYSVRERITVINAMKWIKETLRSDSKTEETNRDTSPGIVYLPRDCRRISHSEELNLPEQPNVFQAAGDLFYRRDTLDIDEKFTYRQSVDGRDHEWSVTRSKESCLEYRTKGESNAFYKPFAKTDEKIIFTQMMDAINSFNKSKTMYINFANCSKATEIKYRLFIRVWNELGKGPFIFCPANSKLKLHDKNIDHDTMKKAIKAKLSLYTDEVQNTLNELNSDSIEKIIDASRRPLSIRRDKG
ncbi:MAG: hypothetical protein RLZZ225_56 [Pseudomonadota bacterium]|jgi:chromosome segregation ATPase